MCSLFSCLAVLTMEYDRILVFKEPVLNKALEGHVIRREKVSDDGSCRVKCYLEPNCVSINVGPLGEGLQTCELNSDTDESPNYHALVERQGFIYLGVEVPFDKKGLSSYLLPQEYLFPFSNRISLVKSKCSERWQKYDVF